MSIDTNQKILYRALNTSRSEIRVLRFTKDSSADRLRLKLKYVSLDDKPKYSALSYVWGDSTEREVIWVNSTPFPATANLVAALRRLFGTEFRAGGLLWADAICINQNDIPERNSQVSMMGRIYEQCWRVLVWLGSGDEKTEATFRIIRKLAIFKKDLNARESSGYRLEEDQASIMGKAISTALDSEAGLFGENSTVYGSMVDVFSTRPYWRRCWTFQELYHAKQAMIMCGHVIISSAEIVTLFRWVFETAAEVASHPRKEAVSEVAWDFIRVLNDDLISFQFAIWHVEFLRQALETPEIEEGPKLNALLSVNLGRKATEPRDWLYSLMGVHKLPILVDYNAPLETVYKQAAVYLHDKGRLCLRLLFVSAGLGTRTGPCSLPSWVPSWDTVGEIWDFVLFSRYADADAGIVNKAPPPRVIGNCLTLWGFEIDQVEKAREGMPRKDILRDIQSQERAQELLNELTETFFDCAPGHLISDIVAGSRPYVTGETCFMALLRYWMQDNSFLLESFCDSLKDETKRANILKAARAFLLYFASDESDLERWREVYDPDDIPDPSFLLDPRASPFTRDDVLRVIYDPGIEDTLLIRLHNCQHNLRAMTKLRTRKGYIGHARSGARPGDIICALAGSQIPAVLRPRTVGEGYELVSYAFLVGAMNGEVWVDAERAGETLKEFVIH